METRSIILETSDIFQLHRYDNRQPKHVFKLGLSWAQSPAVGSAPCTKPQRLETEPRASSDMPKKDDERLAS